MKKNIFISVIIAAFIAIGTLKAADDGDILRAMKDELNRSLSELSIDGLNKPYYIEYSLTKMSELSLEAKCGAVSNDKFSDYAFLTVSVRIGDYKFDNSNFLDFSAFLGSSDDEQVFSGRRIPIDADYSSIRRELWLATDAAYKSAAETFTKKEAALKNRLRKDTTPDFVKMNPTHFIDTSAESAIDYAKFKRIVKNVSAALLPYDKIFSSRVGFEYGFSRMFYANSEGTDFIKDARYCGYESAAFLQSGDGMPLGNFYSAYGLKPNELPGEDSLNKAVIQMVQTLISESDAGELEEPYSGPVMFCGQAAAELFAQLFVPQLVAQRPLLTEMGKQENERTSLFQNKIGGRVLPEFLSLKADPKMKHYNNTPLYGKFTYDDEGVTAEEIILVKDGYLKNLLSQRIPTRRIKSSNGHCRGAGANISNIIMESDASHSKSYEQIKKKMLKLCKDRELPFGIIIKRLYNPNVFATVIYSLSNKLVTPTFGKLLPPIEAYKVYQDGREELLRGTEIGNMAAPSFKDIIMTGKNNFVLNYFSPMMVQATSFSPSRYTPASVIVPDLLFEDVEIKPSDNDLPKPPFVER